MIIQDQEEERNSVTIFINIELIGVERQITFSTHNNTSRTFTIGTFYDNEHYTYLESLLIQTNPKEDESLFEVHAIIPQIKSERKKILEKFSEFNTKIHDDKLGRGDIQISLSFLLKKSYNMYVKQLENVKLRMVLQKILEVINIQKQNSNKAQFDLKLLNPKASMMLDKSTINAIQIFSKEMEKKILSSNNTLYEIFNKCKTSFGTRCLKRWMKQPLQNKAELQSRLDKIEFFISNSVIKNLIQNQLKKLPDLDRLYFVFYKVAAGKKTRCQVSDLIKIYRVVESLSDLVRNLQNKDLENNIISQIYESIKKNVQIIGKISKMIEKGIDMSGPKDNEFYVKPQTQASLEAIMKQRKDIEYQINLQLNKVSKHLSLQVEKIPSNTHKFVFEANKKLAINLVKETPGYKFLTAKQTKITFVTQNLTRFCERLRVVQQQYKNQQQILLRRMFELVAGYYPVMEELSFILSELDVLTSISSIVSSSTGMWCRPKFTDHISGKGMRHPCIKNCVPNDCQMKDHKTIVLTGPNMGGKSTYIRTIGVNVYLAHIGCYVPASQFETPIIDAIITRVGASDLQLKGISTFMSQMLESSCMLETATKNSLVLIDQLGRGTSTCQGFGLAWGICEYLQKQINPYCLFATHFHEMTRMASEVKGVKNMFTMCRVDNGKLVLQYKVEEGKMQKSYGIQVMKILKFPEEVIEEAETYLKYYECDEEADRKINKLSPEMKERIVQLYDEMEEKLSHTNFGSHDQIYEAYRKTLRQIVGTNQ